MDNELIPNLAGQLILDEPARFPINEGSGSETSTDTLTTTEASLLTATFGRNLRSNSKVLVLGTCQINNAATEERQVTLRVRRANSDDSTLVQELIVNVAGATGTITTAREIVNITITDSPATTTAATYSLRGLTNDGSPTATSKALTLIEIPDVTKLP